MFVHADGCTINLSPASMIGKPLTNTVARFGAKGVKGIRLRGGHQQVYSLIRILLVLGIAPQDSVLCTVGGRHNPCPESGRPLIAATGFKNPNPIILVPLVVYHLDMGIYLGTRRRMDYLSF